VAVAESGALVVNATLPGVKTRADRPFAGLPEQREGQQRRRREVDGGFDRLPRADVVDVAAAVAGERRKGIDTVSRTRSPGTRQR